MRDTIRYIGVNDHAIDLFEGQSLPDNHVCPLCKRSAEDFEEMH